MEKLLKTLTRTVSVDCYANRYGRRAFREIESAYGEMLDEMADYASDEAQWRWAQPAPMRCG